MDDGMKNSNVMDNKQNKVYLSTRVYQILLIILIISLTIFLINITKTPTKEAGKFIEEVTASLNDGYNPVQNVFLWALSGIGWIALSALLILFDAVLAIVSAVCAGAFVMSFLDDD
jgi:hypothetical protein